MAWDRRDLDVALAGQPLGIEVGQPKRNPYLVGQGSLGDLSVPLDFIEELEVSLTL